MTNSNKQIFIILHLLEQSTVWGRCILNDEQDTISTLKYTPVHKIAIINFHDKENAMGTQRAVTSDLWN